MVVTITTENNIFIRLEYCKFIIINEKLVIYTKYCVKIDKVFVYLNL